MRKALIYFIILASIAIPANAEIITGGIELTQRDLNDISITPISKSTINPTYQKDSNYIENQYALLQGITELKDRTIAKFSDESYGIIYKSNPLHVYYYAQNGDLIYYAIKNTEKYPQKVYKYTNDGELVNISYRIKPQETYIFSPNKKLIAHWIKDCCYDQNGTIIMKRKIYE